MTPLDGVQSSRTDPRESSQSPLDPARAQDLYAVWSAIFENARPAGFEPSRPGQRLQNPSDARPESFAFGDTQSVNGRSDEVRRVSALAVGALDSPARAGGGVTASLSIQRASGPAQQAAAVEVHATPLAQAVKAATPEVPADVAVHVQYVRAPSAQSPSPVQPEALSIILAGAGVSIVVRDAGLTEADALRTAFETARELTGCSASLQQLTLNGRVLYQQPGATDAAPSRDVLFAC